MALLIMFNNFFHDLSTGIWFSSMLITLLLANWVKKENSPEISLFFHQKLPKLLSINLFSLAIVFCCGIIRALAYYDYEFLPAAGRAQISALMTKHVLLLTAAVLGIYWQFKMRKTNPKPR